MKGRPQVCIEIKTQNGLVNASMVSQTLQVLQPAIHFHENSQVKTEECEGRISWLIHGRQLGKAMIESFESTYLKVRRIGLAECKYVLKAHRLASTRRTVNAKKITALSLTQMLCMS